MKFKVNQKVLHPTDNYREFGIIKELIVKNNGKTTYIYVDIGNDMTLSYLIGQLKPCIFNSPDET